MKNDFGIHVHKTSGQQKLFPPWHISTEQSQYWALCKTTVSQCHAKCNYTVSHEVYLHGYDVYGIKMVIASYQTQQ